MDRTGSTLGRYRLVSLIGSGGMGEIYDAVDPSLGRHVALKILKSDAVGDPKRLNRFIQEARSASALNHPHLVSIYEIGEQDDVHFIAMEKIDGMMLRDLLAQQALPLKRTLELMLQITDGVAAAHGAGIVHRDLKPENIMVSNAGYAKVLDFGLSKLHGEPSLLSSPNAATLAKVTDSGTILGSVGYMSPEQAQGKPVDHRTDIFALGCIFYEAVAGRRAFQGATSIDTLHQTVHAEPAPLQEVAPHVPADVRLIVKKALSKDVEHRYQSAQEMAIDIRNALSSDKPVTAPKHERRKKAPSFIAVLPFENATLDAENDYMVDGITEAVIHRLSEAPGLRVMARSTVFRFRGNDDPLQAGRQLGVAAVVTGRTTIRGNRVTVDAELIDTNDGACLWGKRFERGLLAIQETQEEIAGEISGHLRIKLTSSQEKRVRKRHQADQEAYRLYLQGRFWWNKRPQEVFMKGLDLFQQAIERDPLFALAYSGIADAYAILGSWEAGLMAPRDAMPRAKAAANRAIELDPSLADAWASLGYILLHYDWDWSGSRKAFARALELNPNTVNAHHWVSHLYTAMCEVDHSLEASRRTSDLDPLDLIANVHLAWHFWMARDGNAVIAQSRKTATLEPNSFWPPFFEGLGHELRSDVDLAAEKLRQARARVPNATFPAAALAHVAGKKGERGEALAVLNDLDRIAGSGAYVPAYDRAIVYLGIGEIDDAFAWLERAYEERSGWLAYMQAEPRLDPIRSDPRFTRLTERIGFTSR